MIRSLITLVIIIAVGYWYWSGPYQQKHHPSYRQKLDANAEAMRMCLYGKAYAAGSGKNIVGDPEQLCAKKLNFYQENGEWHDYDDVQLDSY